MCTSSMHVDGYRTHLSRADTHSTWKQRSMNRSLGGHVQEMPWYSLKRDANAALGSRTNAFRSGMPRGVGITIAIDGVPLHAGAYA